jgi:MoaA/NifB/PqqE/SkfB family radical SAM enzyme
MESRTFAAYDAGRSFSDKAVKSACYAPFVSLLFDPRGYVRACCQDLMGSLGNITQQRLADIWHGNVLQEFRTRLIAYDLPHGCTSCKQQIESGNYSGAFAKNFESLPVASEHPEWPRSMEFCLSNTCNLECVQCVGEYSSTVRAHREMKPPLAPAYDDAFFEDLRAFLPNLQRAIFAGGEPFLCRENYRIWDMMIEDGIHIPCIISTNGTIFDKRVERILDRLPCHITVSLDGATRQTVESIRRNARFDEVMANISRFRDYGRERQTIRGMVTRAKDSILQNARPEMVTTEMMRSMVFARQRRMSFGLSFCLMPQNQHEFFGFLRLAEEWGCEATVNTVHYPQQFSMEALPTNELTRIVDEWERLDADVLSTLSRHQNVWTKELARLRSHLSSRSQPPPRFQVYTSIGRLERVNQDAAASPASVEDARVELARWSDNARVDEIWIDLGDIVTSVGSQFAGLEGNLIRGRTIGDVLWELRERHGGAVTVASEVLDPRRMDRVVNFENAAGEQTAVRMITVPGEIDEHGTVGARVLAGVRSGGS